MKKAIMLLSLLAWLPAQAQQTEKLLRLNEERLRLNTTNMIVLGGWALGNIGISSVLRARNTGSVRYFHEMNVVWNFVNLGLAAGGLYGSLSTDPASFDLWQTYAEQQKIEKVLLFNLALNFTYLTAGGYLMERSKTATLRPERLRGYGQSLLLQGGFLLLFDTAQFLLHRRHAYPALQEIIQGLSVSGQGLGFSFNF